MCGRASKEVNVFGRDILEWRVFAGGPSYPLGGRMRKAMMRMMMMIMMMIERPNLTKDTNNILTPGPKKVGSFQ